MKLSDFENYIANAILKRGKDYYRSGAVLTIKQDANSVYKAVVKGTENYTVIVKLGPDDEIQSSQCSCPYDMSPECKHEIAVYYALKKLKREAQPAVTVISLEQHVKKKNATVTESPADRFYRILSALSKEELVTLLSTIAVDYTEIGQRLELKYSGETEEQEIKNCVSIIRSYIDEHLDRDGYIDYENAFEASEGARLVKERADEFTECGQYGRAVNLYLCVIREMVPLLHYSDDSDGYMGSIVQDAVSQLSSMPECDIPPEDAERIFDKLLREAVRKYFYDWIDWQLDLLWTCADLVTTPSMRKKLEKALDTLDADLEDSRSEFYEKEKITKIRYTLIERFDTPDKAIEFIENHLNFQSFREQAISKALTDKDYARAEKLALDGEEKDNQYAGLVSRWKKHRYETYSQSGQMDKQRQIALEFALDGDFDFYMKLKETYPKQEWPAVYSGILKTMEDKKRYYSNYIPILIEEKEWARLLAYVKATPFEVTRQYKYLLPDYKEEVYQVFLQLIRKEAEDAFSRDGYQKVCSYIKLLQKAGGKEQAREAVASLLAAYPRRPALKDELSKIKLK